jgi:hypothetical protein
MAKVSIILPLQTLLAFLQANFIHWSFASHDLQMDLVHA